MGEPYFDSAADCTEDIDVVYVEGSWSMERHHIKVINMRYYNLNGTEINGMSCLEKMGDKNIF